MAQGIAKFNENAGIMWFVCVCVAATPEARPKSKSATKTGT